MKKIEKRTRIVTKKITITNEMETVKKILRIYPKGPAACVLDTWDIYNACKGLSSDQELKELILNREGKFIIRPDSGEPREVLEKCLEILAEGFGYTTFTKTYTDQNGLKSEREYKTLNAKIGLIQGDGIDINTMGAILDYLVIKKGWSLDNFAFGSGGGLLQKVNRDTIKAAIKASYIEINGVGMDIFKDPITAGGSKKSKKGKLSLLKDSNGYRTVNHHDIEVDPTLASIPNAMKLIFKNGQLFNEISYAEILENIKNDTELCNRIQEKQMAMAAQKTTV